MYPEMRGKDGYANVLKVIEALNRSRKAVNGAKVLVLGVAFKPNVDDARNSPAERVIELLLKEGAQVSYHDPYVPRWRMDGLELRSVQDPIEASAAADLTVLLQPHSGYDLASLALDLLMSESTHFLRSGVNLALFHGEDAG